MSWLTRTNDEIDNIKCSAIVDMVVKFIQQHSDVVVLGMSGGVDSTIIASMSVMALGKENVYGIHLPYFATDVYGDKFNARSIKTAEFIQIPNFVVDISHASDSLLGAVEQSLGNSSDMTRGNTNARLRMSVLYAVASTLDTQGNRGRVRVVNTCQLSESAVGYETKWGDGAGDFSPLASLYKQEVYDLADYLISIGCLRECDVDRIPSAGLFDGQSDESEIGFSYNEMAPYVDAIFADRGYAEIRHYSEDDLKNCISSVGLEYNECARKVVRMYIMSRHKMYTMPQLGLANRI